MNHETTPNFASKRNVTITSLCIFLWIAAAAFIGLSVWLAIHGAGFYAGLSAAGALLASAAGLGLFRMRRWGAVAFGAFAMLGAVNHFSGALQELSIASGAGLALASLNLVAAVLITIFMAYLVLLLWRNTK